MYNQYDKQKKSKDDYRFFASQTKNTVTKRFLSLNDGTRGLAQGEMTVAWSWLTVSAKPQEHTGQLTKEQR